MFLQTLSPFNGKSLSTMPAVPLDDPQASHVCRLWRCFLCLERLPYEASAVRPQWRNELVSRMCSDLITSVLCQSDSSNEVNSKSFPALPQMALFARCWKQPTSTRSGVTLTSCDGRPMHSDLNTWSVFATMH